MWTWILCISDSSNVITTRFYSGCSWKCITLVSTFSSLVRFKTTSLNWITLVMRKLILVWCIFRSNPHHLLVIIQYHHNTSAVREGAFIWRVKTSNLFSSWGWCSQKETLASQAIFFDVFNFKEWWTYFTEVVVVKWSISVNFPRGVQNDLKLMMRYDAMTSCTIISFCEYNSVECK